MRKKIIFISLIMTTLANSILFSATPISGPNFGQPLEIYSIWNPNSSPLFILYANNSSIDYSQSTIQYETEDYDLSVSNQTDDFTLYVESNFYRPRNKYYLYDLNIYFSKYFVPVDDTEYNEGAYPEVELNLNATVSTDYFEMWTPPYYSYYYYIVPDYNVQNQNATLLYNGRSVEASKYTYSILISTGSHALDLIDFNFSWTGYTGATRYWDMEGYVLVELESV
ncbi:MAG: hypothetical protein ACPKM0_06575 [Pleomorphochaeta sp.]